MKRRIFSAILTASMLLTQSVLVFGEEATDVTDTTETTTTVSVPYTQDFEDATLTAKDYTTGTATAVTDTAFFEQKSDEVTGNGYGRFHQNNTKWFRIGFQVDENGVTAGKLNVSFRFRPFGLSDDRKQLTFVGLGDTTGKETAYLSLLGINGTSTSTGDTYLGKMGVLNSNGTSYPMQAADGTNAVLTSADAGKWFTYNAVVDLDTHSIDVEVVREEDGAKYTYSKTKMDTRGASGWGLWPVTTKMQTFVAMGPIDIDDLSITHILNAQKLTFISANGAESAECSIFTPKAKITFNTAVKAIPENAVTMDGVDCSGGVLSDDGMSYTFDIPDTLISGTAHNVAVDTSKLEPVLEGVLAGDGEEFDFTVAATEVTTAVYTQNFEDTTLTANNYTNSDTSKAATANEFKIATDDGDDVTDKNYYGSFHSGDSGAWTRVGLNIGTPGPKEGILKVNFRFRPVEVGTRAAFVALGYDTKAKNNHRLAVLGVSKDGSMGVLHSNGVSYRMQAADGTNAVLKSEDASKWFDYSAVLNLDTRSLDVEVMRESDGTKYTYRKDNIDVRSNGGDTWDNWPQITELRNFMVMGAMNIDDLSITYDTNPAIIADEDGVEASVIAATEGKNLLIIAQYDDAGRLVNVIRSDIELEDGQSAVLEAEAAWDKDAETAKAFIWDNLENCTPLGTVKLASKPASTTEGE